MFVVENISFPLNRVMVMMIDKPIVLSQAIRVRKVIIINGGHVFVLIFLVISRSVDNRENSMVIKRLRACFCVIVIIIIPVIIMK